MAKKTYFYIDDVIWVFRDLTRQRPACLFDQCLLKPLKEAHDKYGLKVVLNAFYQTDNYYGNDEFSLADMTDAYKDQWEEASDWLRIGFHARQEFPDYPYVNASYEQVKQDFENMKREVQRFAGDKTFSCSVYNPHWNPVSKAGVQALYDCGVRLMSATLGPRHPYTGDPSTLPYGHAARLLLNRQPETMLYRRGTLNKAIDSSICGYNHLTGDVEDLVKNTLAYVTDEDTGMHYKRLCGGPTLNLSSTEGLEEEFSKYLGNEYIGYASHEQYSFPDYFAYQPEHNEKILEAARILSQAGYTYFFVDELV